jgi:hypothetical protein
MAFDITFYLFGIVKRIVDTKAQFRSLAEPWAAGTSTGRLMLAVLGGLADVEVVPLRKYSSQAYRYAPTASGA